MTMTHVATVPLIDMLGDLLLTSSVDGSTCGVLLHTARGYANPAEPGKSDILVGTSSSGRAIGHTWIGTAGKVPPMLWHANDVRNVISVFKACQKGVKDHHVDITRQGADVILAEDPQLFGETSLRFRAQSLDDFPRDLWKIVDGSDLADELDTEPMPRTDLDPRSLAALAKIATRRREPVRMFRTHQRRPVLVEIGPTYRGAVHPWHWDLESTQDGKTPGTDMHAPKLPAPSAKPKDADDGAK